jgi:hypothetical protein
MGEGLPRYARRVRVIELISIVSNVARQMRVAARCAPFIA